MKSSKWVAMIMMTLFLAGSGGCAQPVTVSPGETGDLAHRWEWAAQSATQYSRGVWIGYGIERLMGVGSFMGNRSGRDAGLPTLMEVLAGTTAVAVKVYPDDQARPQRASERALLRREMSDEAEPMELKKVALLFYIPVKPAQITGATDLTISDLTRPVDLENHPLIWLGMAGQQESVSFLGSSYRQAATEAVKKDLIVAVGLHQISGAVIPFLSGVVQSNDPDTLREDATFWLGQQPSERVVGLLARTARTDRSQKVRERAVFALSQHQSQQAWDTLLSLARDAGNAGVREQAVFWLGQSRDTAVVKILTELARNDSSRGVRKKAVFALSQQESGAAVDALIDLARHGNTRGMRQEAIFWLGQKASQTVAGDLKEMAYQDPEIEIQEQAVFALSQLPDRSGISALIDIARNHSNLSVRKKAIFWLGQSRDPRAVEAIVQIIKSH